MFRAARFQPLVVCGILVYSGTAAFGQACGAPEVNSPQYVSWLSKLDFHKNWYANEFPTTLLTNQSNTASMKVRIAPTGIITHLTVYETSGSPQADFSCLESIASAAPFNAMPAKRSLVPELPAGSVLKNNVAPARYQAIVSFGGTERPKPSPEEKSFTDSHPVVKKYSCYLMHLIPLGINEHFGEMFSEKELLGLKNIVALKGNIEPDEALEPFLRDWQAFISNHKSATKNEIIQESQNIKNAHKNLFAIVD